MSLEKTRELIPGDGAIIIIGTVNKGGKVTIRRMTAQAVLGALVKRVEQTKIAEASPHDLRRSFIMHLLDAGADVLSVQKLAGHANTQTTLRYDRRDEKGKRKAVDLLHVPSPLGAGHCVVHFC